LTAGASTPESLVEETIAKLEDSGCGDVHQLITAQENVTFPLPIGLRAVKSGDGPQTKAGH
jgi:4-hydroxy-3-methylbut-2-enyl diphosphate reductase